MSQEQVPWIGTHIAISYLRVGKPSVRLCEHGGKWESDLLADAAAGRLLQRQQEY